MKNTEVTPLYPVLETVDSSVIQALGYTHGLLFVEFHHSNAIYIYFGVSFQVFMELKNSESIGTYYNDCVKAQYESARIV